MIGCATLADGPERECEVSIRRSRSGEKPDPEEPTTVTDAAPAEEPALAP